MGGRGGEGGGRVHGLQHLLLMTHLGRGTRMGTGLAFRTHVAHNNKYKYTFVEGWRAICHLYLQPCSPLLPTLCEVSTQDICMRVVGTQDMHV